MPFAPYGPNNRHPLSQLKTELVWEGKYDEYGKRRELDIAGAAMPVSLAVAPLMSDALGQTMFNAKMDYSYNYQAVFAWLGFTLVIAALASIFPARSATRISVRQSLVYE